MDFSYARNGGGSGSGSESGSEESGMEWEEVAAVDAPEASTSASTSAQVGNDKTGSTKDLGGAATSNTVAAGAASGKRDDEIQVTLKPGTIVTMSSKGKGKGKANGARSALTAQAAAERLQRQSVHKAHTACLLVSGHVRNGWLNDRTLQARLVSKVPLSVQSRFTEYSKATHPKATDRSRLFERAMRDLMGWWCDKFIIEDEQSLLNLKEGEGILETLKAPHSIDTMDYTAMQALLAELSPKDKTRLLMPFAEEPDLLALLEGFPSTSKSSSSTKKAKPPKLPKALSTELGELIRNAQSLAKRALKMSGTRDMSAQLFTALCRGLDIPARLVCSLPAVDHRSASKAAKDEKMLDGPGGAAAANGRKRKRGTRAKGGGKSATSAENSFEENNTHTGEDDDDDPEDADFEEVEIPAALPSSAFKKAAKTGGSNGALKRQSLSKTASKALSSSASNKRAASIEIDDESATLPIFWTEVYNRSLQEWITVDVVRNRMRPKKGEYDLGHLFYVVAYEVDQYIKDVTARYARSYAGRTLKMRVGSGRRREGDPDWWDDLLRPWARPFILGREKKEDEELLRHQETEPMPTILEGFKNHPRYALERHLKREEALAPRAKQLGLFRGEPVFPRAAVIPVKSSETWMREGRRIRQSEQPLKMVKQRAVTIIKRRAQEMAQQEGLEPVMQGLYSASQTELVIPPPLVDGKVPKNSYGNLDLFAPHMLPRGAVHLPFKTVRKVAKDLGIDFAEAVTGFEFHKRRAIPVVAGIVIAAEHEAMVLDAYYTQESAAAERELEKRRERCLKRWKRLIIGLRVRNRIQGEYKKDKSGAASSAKKGSGSAQASAGEREEAEEKSQFQPLPEELERLRAAGTGAEKDTSTKPPDLSATSGGFIHTDSVDASRPGGAAFPPPPHVDLGSIKLPPMPVPKPAGPLDDSDNDGFKPTYNGQLGAPQLDDFTLAAPEDLAKGAPEIEEEEGGGFMREEDEEEEEELAKGVARKDFALPRGKRNGRAVPKKESSPSPSTVDEDDSDDVDMEEVVSDSKAELTQKSKQEDLEVDDDEEKKEHEEEDRVDEEADYHEASPSLSPSPPPAKRTRATRTSGRNAGGRSAKVVPSPAAPSTTGRPTRSTRQSARTAATSSPAKAENGSKARASRQNQATVRETPKRPTRAAAAKARSSAVIEVESSEGEPDAEEEDQDDDG